MSESPTPYESRTPSEPTTPRPVASESPRKVTTSPQAFAKRTPAVTTKVGLAVRSRSASQSSNDSVESNTVHPLDCQRTATFEELTKCQPADPRNLIESLIRESGQISASLDDIETQLNWCAEYEDHYGTLHEYLLSYQAIFVVSPVADSVALRSQGIDPTSRRSTKPKKQQSTSSLIGSVSYSSIAEGFKIEGLFPIYRNRGYIVEQIGADVLHVSSGSIDLFVLRSGVVVWWGMNRTDHWIVDDDFFEDSSLVCSRYAEERHWQKDIWELFPNWCTFEYDKNAVVLDEQLDVDSNRAALERFQEKLCFDHFLIPSDEPQRTQVMLVVSLSLGRSAKVDYLEHITQATQKAVLAIPVEPKSLWGHFSARKQISQLEGELRVAQMGITALHETPDILWDMPWLRAYFVLAESQTSVEPRRDWFLARSDALFQKLQSIQARRHRLFMMSSDVFLIVLLVLDVIALLMRLSVKMYFPRDDAPS